MNNEFISIMTDRIVREFDPLQIILFGSQARGDADPDSDIDLLVVFSELTDKRKTAVDIGVAHYLMCPWQRTSLSQHRKSWNVVARESDRCCGMPNKRVKSFGRT
ncbi:MAG: nucleotidyltransferase domain-containing protein [Candidatus Poribacteria bacterium]|nr:nucleotidyltransferase domain-containing protein [Candidatus Poribacteria bacterium]